MLWLHHVIHCIAGKHVSTDAARAFTCHATRSFVFRCDVETRSYDDGFRWAMFHLKTQLLSGEPRIAGRRERGEASAEFAEVQQSQKTRAFPWTT